MPRIADALERESRSVELEPGDFERLLVRRERKLRNRRIRAGVIAVIVALATAAFLLRAITPKYVPADRVIPPAAAPGTLAYVLDGDIYVADPDGSNAVKIADGCSEGTCGHGDQSYSAEGPMWSPDGRYLAYRSLKGGVISDAEGNVVATFPLDGWQIAWSPDSTRVAAWDSVFETIGVYGLDGARQAQLAMPSGWSPSGDHDPEWMPDGTAVWVENWELPLDGSAPQRLPARGGDPYATYSPDGSLVAYGVYSSGPPEHTSLWVARADGSEPREVLSRGAGADSNWGYAWSPTGDRIVVSSNGLRIVDVATGSVTQLSGEERGTSVSVIGFSPDGDRILLRRDRGNKSSLWSIGVDGSDPQLVVDGTWQGEWLS